MVKLKKSKKSKKNQNSQKISPKYNSKTNEEEKRLRERNKYQEQRQKIVDDLRLII